jgi:hypothetical protein
MVYFWIFAVVLHLVIFAIDLIDENIIAVVIESDISAEHSSGCDKVGEYRKCLGIIQILISPQYKYK